MTQEELQTIRERAAAATPGPWACWNAWNMTGTPYNPQDSDIVAFTRIGPDDVRAGLTTEFQRADINATAADAQFVANARTDIPALLGHIAAQAEQIKRLRAFVAQVLSIDADTDEDEDYYYISPSDFAKAIDTATGLETWLDANDNTPA